MITLTEIAANKIKELLLEKDESGIRAGVRGGAQGAQPGRLLVNQPARVRARVPAHLQNATTGRHHRARRRLQAHHMTHAPCQLARAHKYTCMYT